MARRCRQLVPLLWQRNWEFDEARFDALRIASINDLPIAEAAQFRWPRHAPGRPSGLTELGSGRAAARQPGRSVAERADVIPGEVCVRFRRRQPCDHQPGDRSRQRQPLSFLSGGRRRWPPPSWRRIDAWFESRSLRRCAKKRMPTGRWSRCWLPVNAHFRSGKRVCLVGVFALDDTRIVSPIGYKAISLPGPTRWTAPCAALGRNPSEAHHLAEEAVGAIQGALVLPGP